MHRAIPAGEGYQGRPTSEQLLNGFYSDLSLALEERVEEVTPTPRYTGPGIDRSTAALMTTYVPIEHVMSPVGNLD